MDAFNSLPIEKQQQILTAGFFCFGILGYKKASIADIAQKAGISKAMVFHYFDTKKNLYKHLLETACNLMEDAVKASMEKCSDDFFDKITADIKSKEIVMCIYPSILQFLSSVLMEDSAEVADEIKLVKERGTGFHTSHILDTADISKFKETVKPALVIELILSYMENIAKSISNEEADAPVIFCKAYECIEMMRINFYKPEYLERS